MIRISAISWGLICGNNGCLLGDGAGAEQRTVLKEGVAAFCWQAVALCAKNQTLPKGSPMREAVKIYSISGIKKVGKYVRIVGKG